MEPSLPIAIAVDDQTVYFASFGGLPPEAAGAIAMVPKAGGTTTVLAADRRRPVAISLNAGSLFWAEQGETDADGSIHVVGKVGGASTLLAPSAERPIALAHHAG